MKISDYDVVVGSNLESLVLGTMVAIEKGWQPIGGISVEREVVQLDGSLRTQYLQAMIRTEQPKRTTHPLSTKVGKQ